MVWTLFIFIFGTCGGVSVISRQLVKCDVSGDVIFILDGSGSIKPIDWTKQLNFVENLFDSLDVQPVAINVGIIVYGTFIGNVIGLKPYRDKAILKSLVRGLTYQGDGTNTARGIEEARKMFRGQGRPNVPHVAVVITDGRSTNTMDTFYQTLTAKRDDGIIIFALGLGKEILIDELQTMATSEETFFIVADHSALPGLVQSLRDSICSVITTTAPTTTTTTTTMTPLSPEVITTTTPTTSTSTTATTNTTKKPLSSEVNCPFKAHPDRRNYIETITGHGHIIRSCAPGTVFSLAACTCIIGA